MTYLPSIVAIIVCCLAWYLTRVSQNTDLKKQEHRKLNRLIFNLLELKYLVDKEVDLDKQLKDYLDEYEKEVIKYAPDISKEQFCTVRKTLSDLVKRQVLAQSQLPNIEGTIEEIIKEMAEVDPVFAFELTGKYQISNNLNRVQTFMDIADSSTEGVPTREIMVDQFLRPKMMKDLQADLHRNIPLIAKRADKVVYNKVCMLNNTTAIKIDKGELSQFLAELMPKLLNTADPLC